MPYAEEGANGSRAGKVRDRFGGCVGNLFVGSSGKGPVRRVSSGSSGEPNDSGLVARPPETAFGA